MDTQEQVSCQSGEPGHAQIAYLHPLDGYCFHCECEGDMSEVGCGERKEI